MCYFKISSDACMYIPYTCVEYPHIGFQWQFQQQLTGHNNVICSLASVTYENNTYITSASSDSTVKLFKRQGKEGFFLKIVKILFKMICYDKSSIILLFMFLDFQCVQTISFGNGFSHTLAMSILPSSNGKSFPGFCVCPIYAQNNTAIFLTVRIAMWSSKLIHERTFFL